MHRWHDPYIENPKYAIRKLLELINEFGKVSGHESNTKKPLVLVYTNNEKSQKRWRKQTYLLSEE